MNLYDFGLITLMGLLWTIFGMVSGAWLLVPLAASYTGMLWAMSAERIAQHRKENPGEKE
jgi:hypothetical protein